MNRLQRALIRLAADLRRLDVRWALIGGLAVSARAEPRTTKDVDLAVAVEGNPELESLVRDLLARGYRISSPPHEHLDLDRIASVHLQAPGTGGVIVDLLAATSGIEPEVVAAAEPFEVYAGFTAPLVTTGHLLALKTLAGRFQDLADFQNLIQHSENRHLQEARDAMDLITRRGFNRGKDLQAEFMRLLKIVRKADTTFRPRL